MLPKTVVRMQRRLCRDSWAVAASSGASSGVSSGAPGPSPHASTYCLSNSSSTLPSQRETRRGHFVVRRRWWLPHIPNLEDVSKYPYDTSERGDFHVYDQVAATHEGPRPDIDVILTKYVEGYGDIGDAISVSSEDARDYLIPAQMALYDTPDNRNRVQKTLERLNLVHRIQRTPFATLTSRQLEERLTLPIVMNPNHAWKLEKFHALVALRKVGVVVESEDCVELPDFEVTEPRDIEIGVTINGTDKVKVRAKVLHWFIDLDGVITHDAVEIWSKPKEKPKEWRIRAAEPVRRIE